MARVLAPTGNRDYSALEEGEWYDLTLNEVRAISADDEESGGFGATTRITFDIPSQPEIGTLRTYASNRIGERKGGKVSKLREILNAVAGMKSSTAIAWWDDESFEWSYGGDSPVYKLDVGDGLQGRGYFQTRDDGSTMYRLDGFRQKRSGSQAAPVAASSSETAYERPAKARPHSNGDTSPDIDPDDLPF